MLGFYDNVVDQHSSLIDYFTNTFVFQLQGFQGPEGLPGPRGYKVKYRYLKARWFILNGLLVARNIGWEKPGAIFPAVFLERLGYIASQKMADLSLNCRSNCTHITRNRINCSFERACSWCSFCHNLHLNILKFWNLYFRETKEHLVRLEQRDQE